MIIWLRNQRKIRYRTFQLRSDQPDQGRDSQDAGELPFESIDAKHSPSFEEINEFQDACSPHRDGGAAPGIGMGNMGGLQFRAGEERPRSADRVAVAVRSGLNNLLLSSIHFLQT